MEQTEFQYEVTYKREASKGIDGFTVTARGNIKDVVLQDAKDMRRAAMNESSVVAVMEA